MFPALYHNEDWKGTDVVQVRKTVSPAQSSINDLYVDPTPEIAVSLSV